MDVIPSFSRGILFINANQGLDFSKSCVVTQSLSKGVRWLAHILRQAQYDQRAQPLFLLLIGIINGSAY